MSLYMKLLVNLSSVPKMTDLHLCQNDKMDKYLSTNDKMTMVMIVAKVEDVEIVGRVSANGRVVIPKDIRDLLNIEDGDFVRIVIREVIKVPKSAKNGSNKKRKR